MAAAVGGEAGGEGGVTETVTRYLTSRKLPARPPLHCRWCGKPVSGRRRTWCSQACVDEFLVRNSGNVARSRVFDRDGGICAVCGLDCEALNHTLREMLRDFKRQFYHDPAPGRYERLFQEFMDGLARYGLRRFLFRSAWEVHHKHSVKQGGGACGLDNLQTLCWRCHAAETRELRRRLAASKSVAPA